MPEHFECHGLDTQTKVCFYENDFYVLSNFSSFSIKHGGQIFPTSEHLYQWSKFQPDIDIFRNFCPKMAEWQWEIADKISIEIKKAPSAHEAFKIAQHCDTFKRSDWDNIRELRMKKILYAKAMQHSYVLKKLLATGDRELVENSWRDDFWGEGPDKRGSNMLGKLWMEVREGIRKQKSPA